jgi:hypothetical protein
MGCAQGLGRIASRIGLLAGLLLALMLLATATAPASRAHRLARAHQRHADTDRRGAPDPDDRRHTTSRKRHRHTKSRGHHGHHKAITGRPMTPAPTPTKSAQVRAMPVSLSVANVNTSMVPCSPDGNSYTLAGTLFLPAQSTPAGVTLYVHGLGFAGYFWHFTAVGGYDYATTEAEHGHASMVIDRLGYGASSIPPGTASCVGGQASIVHQVVQALRHGSYQATGTARSPSFSRVGLAGHSAGGQLVQIEAYSFSDIDALAVMDWADQSYSPSALSAFGAAGSQCAGGGSPQVGGRSNGYGAYGQTTAQYDSLMFHDTDPAVLAAANAMRTLDPCGDINSILNGVSVDVANVGSIKVPIAYVWGDQDANYIAGSPWWQQQEAMYSSSPKVTDVTLTNTGHAVTLERSAPRLQTAMNHWLTANGL